MKQSPVLKLVEDKASREIGYKRFIGELWTPQQRQMHSLHYIVSYRASFKPELPDFCIQRYSKRGDIVLDPFCGRGTTPLQANLLGRTAWFSDVNPLALRMTRAKTTPVGLDEIVLRLNEVDFRRPVALTNYQEHFSMFYHPDTYRELINLKNIIRKKQDQVNAFVELLALSRLHGHSPGFFSVYSFPQISIPPESQRLINLKRRQEPEYRAVAPRIIRKAAQALRDGFTSNFFEAADLNKSELADARNLHWIAANSVDLIVTSPPFLDKVDYLADNWMEFWFCDIRSEHFSSNLIMASTVDEWRSFIHGVLAEMVRVLKPRGYAVIEVGEVENQGRTVFLDEIVAAEAGKVSGGGKSLIVEEVLINQQSFTKLANCFKVDNNRKGTNTNRLVVMKCIAKGARR